MKNPAHTLRLAAVSLLILTACAEAQQPAAPATETASLWQKIQAANSNLGCDNDSQCQTIGVGAKACGGPEGYLAWSSKNTNGGQLKSLVEQYAAARREDNKKQGMMSNCMLISDPGATCQAGRCAIKQIAPPP